MTLRRFNLLLCIGCALIMALDHKWFGATGWINAALLQFGIVMDEWDDKRRIYGKSRQ